MTVKKLSKQNRASPSQRQSAKFMSMYRNSILLFVLAISFESFAQFPSLSPQGSVEQQVGDTHIKILYERPAARGRNIFGSLVPYDKMWRTGAGNCTKISFTKPVVIGMTSIPVGTYSFLTIPGVNSWTIILNKDTTLYGLNGYSSDDDIVRLNTPVRSTTRFYESLTFDIDVVPNNAVIHLSWANVHVGFLVQTCIDKHASDYISKKLLSKQSKNPEEYAVAAEYMYYMGTDLESSNALVSHALTLKKELWYYRLRIDILARLNRSKEAFAVADDAINWINSRKDWNEREKTEFRSEYEKRKMELLKTERK